MSVSWETPPKVDAALHRAGAVAGKPDDGFRKMLDLLPAAIYTTDAHGRLTYFNPACVAFSGRTPELGTDQWCVSWKLFHVDGRPMPHDECPMAIALKEGRAVRGVEAVAERPDGQRIHFEPYPTPLFDDEGNVVGGINMLIDITERRRAEDALRERAKQHRQTLSIMPAAVYSCDAAGVISYYNDCAAELWGRAPRIGDTDERFCGSEQMILPDGTPLPHEQCPMAVALREGRSFRNEEVCIRRPDGSLVPVLVNVDPVCDEQGSIIGAINAFQDISARKQADAALQEQAQALRESEERFRMIADNMDQLAWTCDELGNATWYNRRWVEYTGISLEEMQGWGWNKVQHPDHITRVVEGVRRSAETGEPWEDMFPLRGKDGRYRWFLSRALPIRNEDGDIVRWFGTNTDVTDQRAAEEALREAGRRKDEFLAVLSHELRNPLAPLSMGVELMQRGRSKPELLDSIRPMMKRQLEQLTRLVDDLLDVSRMNRGHAELQREPFDLRDAAEAAIEQIRPQIDEKGHRLMTLLGELSLPILGDFHRLTQILANLLSNAAKYSGVGGKITVRADRENGEAVVRVTDTGFGIPKERLHELFDMFTQVPEHRALVGGGGLGIGLALCRQLVELHGGSIEAHSEGIGSGSEFTVRLPLHFAEHDAERTRTSAEAALQPSRRVLVVDDNVDATAALAMILELQGHAVSTAYDGPAALLAVEQFHPDFVLLDLGLPLMDGFEVARRIRAMPSADRVTLIALTGWGQPEDRQRSAEAGFDAHLTKPVDTVQLSTLLGHQH